MEGDSAPLEWESGHGTQPLDQSGGRVCRPSSLFSMFVEAAVERCMAMLDNLRDDPRVTVRRDHKPQAGGNSTGRKFDAKSYIADVERMERCHA